MPALEFAISSFISTLRSFMPSVHEQYKELLKGGAICGGDKLSYNNWKSWFITVDYWAITKNVKWIYDNLAKSKLRRANAEEDETEFVNAAVIIKLLERLCAEDKHFFITFRTAHELYIELVAKYTDRFLIKNEKLIREFHNYKLSKDETVVHAWIYLKLLCREIISNNDLLESAYI